MLRKCKFLIAKFIKKMCIPSAFNNCKISKKAYVCSQGDFNSMTLGDYSYVGYRGFINNTSIGKYVSIADNCRIGGDEHPTKWVSTSPVFIKGKNVLGVHFSDHSFTSSVRTIIENDVWIGANVLIKAGVHIYTGAVIGMGAVVTHDVGPYEVWGGNPARMIRKRFDDKTISLLLESHWWELEENIVRKYSNYIDNPDEFLNRVKDEK